MLISRYWARLGAVVLGLGLSCSGQAQTSASTMPARMQVVVAGHKLPASSYGFYVQEVGNGATVLTINANAALNPASTMKVLTTLAALEQLGPTFTWNTRVYALGPVNDGILQGDLLIKGGGDPYLLEEQVRNMLKAVQRAGIIRITGDLLLDTSYFDAGSGQDNMIDNKKDRAYNVLPNALMSNFQAVTFYIHPSADGKHVDIHPDPALANLQITNDVHLKKGACDGYQHGLKFVEDAAHPEHVVWSGDYPSACKEDAMVRAVLTPATFFYGLFGKLWAELGGEFNGSVRVGKAPDQVPPLVQWSSPPLADVIRSINKFSNNLMTRQTLLTLGAERFAAPATVANGGSVVTEYLQMLGINSEALVVSNGAGLAREARITPALLNQVLQHGHDSPYMAEFISSLPLNGIDGTMRNRLRSERMRGNMHIKTGTLEEVSAVAGYVTAKSGKQYTVVGMLNHSEADRGPGVELMDALLAWVFEH